MGEFLVQFSEPNLVPKTGPRPAQTLHLPNMLPRWFNFQDQLWFRKLDQIWSQFFAKKGFWDATFSKFFCSISAHRSTERCRGQNEPFIPAKLVACRHTFLTRIVCLHWHRPLAQNIPRAQVRFGFRLVVIIVQWRGIRLLLSLILTAVAKPSSFVIIRLHSFQSNSFFFSPPHSSQVTFLQLHSSSLISTHRHLSSSIFNHLRSPSLMPIHFHSSSAIFMHLHSSSFISTHSHSPSSRPSGIDGARPLEFPARGERIPDTAPES